MNKEQYNNIIDNTLLAISAVNESTNLNKIRNVLRNMGIPLPSGSFEDVFKGLYTNCYMGWRFCSLQDAQNYANDGTPSIGIGKNGIFIIRACDGKTSTINKDNFISLNESTQVHHIAGTLFYSYTAMRSSGNVYSNVTWSSLDAAMDYYGRDFTYTSCEGYYNYYYTFSDGSRMYFHVG